MIETCRPWRFFYAGKWKVHVSNIQFKPDYFFRWYMILRAAVHRVAKLLLHMFFSLDQPVTKKPKTKNKYFVHPIFWFWFLVTFGIEVMKIWKYYIIFEYILQGKMGKTEKPRKENRATKVTKIPKNKRLKNGMNET